MTDQTYPILVLKKDASQKERTEKEKVDKKIEKVAKLKRQATTLRSKIATIKRYYKEEVETEMQSLFQVKEQFLEKLYQRLLQKSFSGWQKSMLSNMIFDTLNELQDWGYSSQKLMTIREDLERMDMQNMSSDDKEFMNEMAKEYLKDMQVDFEEKDFDITDSDSRERIFEDIFSKQQEAHWERQEEWKQFQKSGKIENTDKNFQKLYRSLVKATHPDLASTEEEREECEHRMKLLSEIWEKRDYLGLMQLQKEILPESEGKESIELDKEQLRSLTRQLNEEIRMLEDELYQIKHVDNESSFFYENFYTRSEKGTRQKITDYKKGIDNQVAQIKTDIEQLRTQKTTKELLRSIDEQRADFSSSFYFDDF